MNHLVIKHKNKVFIFATLYVCWVIVFTYFNTLNEKKALYQQLDQQLEDAALTARLILPASLHSMGMKANSLTKEQRYNNILALSAFTDKRDISYLYTLILREDKVLFTSSSATPEERESGEKLSFYYDHYDDVDPRVFDIFTHKKKSYLEFTDQWGTFRSVFIPSYSEDGTFYIAVADLSISHIETLLKQQVYHSLTIAVLFLIFGYPLYYVAIAKLNSITNAQRETIHKQTLDLRLSEARLSNAMASAQQSWFDVNLLTGGIEVSDEFPKFLCLGNKRLKFSLNIWKRYIHPDDKESVLRAFDNCLKSSKPFTIEYRIKTATGYWKWLSSVGSVTQWNEENTPSRMIGISRNITEQKRSELVLQTLAETDLSAAEGDIFKAIVRQLALSQDMRYAFIAKLNKDDNTQADTLAVWANGKLAENFSYSLIGTPCESVINDGDEVAFWNHDIQQQFPEDLMLVNMEAVSYVGTALKDHSGESIGLLSMIHDSPVLINQNTLDLLKSLAVRSAMEIEREKTVAAFQKYQDDLLQNQRVLLILSKETFFDKKDAFTKIISVDAKQLNVSRVSIWLFNKDKSAINCQALYNQGKFSTELPSLRAIDYPKYFEVLNDTGFVVADDAHNHPSTKEFTENYLLPLGISSMLDTPIRIRGEVVGVTCHEHRGPKRVWTKESEDFARSISDLCAQVLLEDERRIAEEKLDFMAHYDGLTQLPNRALFVDRFNQAVSRSKRTNKMIAIGFLDLDNFKPVNDKFGHDVGDQLLIEMATRIKEIIREGDTVSRQGGDEFALLLGDIESYTQCKHLFNRICSALAKPYNINGFSHEVSVSIGTTLYPLDDSDLDTLLRHADQAMYQAKQAGKNQIKFFNATQNQQLVYEQSQLQKISQALVNNEFQLYYQPKVNMKTGNVYGAEALIRWIHPKKGLIPPLDFLPLVSGTNLEIKIGGWVINQALQQMNEWQKQGVKLEVSINISSHHLQSPVFFDQVGISLRKYSEVNPHNLQLEILESSALGDLNDVSRIIKQCQDEIGVTVALDDFGTGYSS